MAERKIIDPELQKLFEENGISYGIDRAKNGYPRVNITFPTLEKMPPKKAVCLGCGKPAETIISEPKEDGIVEGVRLRFINLRDWQVESCPVDKLLNDHQAFEDIAYNTESEAAKLYDECIRHSNPSDIKEFALQVEIKSRLYQIMKKAKVGMMPPLVSKIRDVLS